MNTALIFAGGTGKRMGTAGRPKQFLELHGKPIIIHTLEHFDRHPEIDAIAVVCIAGWIDYLRDQLERWRIKKVRWIVPGGETSQDSTRAGLGILADNCDPENTIVLIHDGVRPLITEKLITDNIAAVKAYGNAITAAPAIETIITVDENEDVTELIDRQSCRLARAPQSFMLCDIIAMSLTMAAFGIYCSGTSLSTSTVKFRSKFVGLYVSTTLMVQSPLASWVAST